MDFTGTTPADPQETIKIEPKCAGRDCTVRDTCLRYTATNSTNYWVQPLIKDEACVYRKLMKSYPNG